MEAIEIGKIKSKPKIKIIDNQSILKYFENANQHNTENISIPVDNSLVRNSAKAILEFILLLIILLPALFIILVIAVLLIIPNKGKVIFKQQRIGHKGTPFTLYKFRTLNGFIDINIEKNTQIIKENTHSFGYFLRKTGLDEILQIVNVIKGDMNLIGPRPLLMKDLTHLTKSQFYTRHLIKPGILGLWQIKRNYSDDINYFRYDNLYLKKQSLFLDLYIVFGTVIYMFKGKGR